MIESRMTVAGWDLDLGLFFVKMFMPWKSNELIKMASLETLNLLDILLLEVEGFTKEVVATVESI